MTTTDTTTARLDQAISYSLHIVFTRDAGSDANLDDDRAIRDEATSWLQSLGATVHVVTVCSAHDPRSSLE
jgi:hypothetical protein